MARWMLGWMIGSTAVIVLLLAASAFAWTSTVSCTATSATAYTLQKSTDKRATLANVPGAVALPACSFAYTGAETSVDFRWLATNAAGQTIAVAGTYHDESGQPPLVQSQGSN